MDLTATLISKIFNPALIHIAEKTLTGVSDTATAADKCKDLYESVRNAELRERIWLSTVTRTTLTKDATAPEYEWDYRYSEPSTSLYIINLEDDEDFTIESGYILTNFADTSNQVGVKYVQAADIDTGSALDLEVARWDAGLVNVIIERMAATLAMALSKKRSSREEAWILYDRALDAAKLSNAFEDRHERHNRVEEESSWITSRGAE